MGSGVFSGVWPTASISAVQYIIWCCVIGRHSFDGVLLEQQSDTRENSIVQHTLYMLYAFILTLLATTAPALRVVPVTACIHTDMIYFVSRYPILSNTCGTDYAAHTAAAYVTFCIALYSANSRPIHWYRNSFGSGHIYIYMYMR